VPYRADYRLTFALSPWEAIHPVATPDGDLTPDFPGF